MKGLLDTSVLIAEDAVTAHAHQLRLYTRNRQDFELFAGLIVGG